MIAAALIAGLAFIALLAIALVAGVTFIALLAGVAAWSDSLFQFFHFEDHGFVHRFYTMLRFSPAVEDSGRTDATGVIPSPSLREHAYSSRSHTAGHVGVYPIRAAGVPPDVKS